MIAASVGPDDIGDVGVTVFPGSGSPPGGAATRIVKQLVRDALSLPDDATVMVAELACHEPDCPPIETVIAVFEDGGRREFRLHLRVDEIDATALAGVLTP